MAQVASSAGAQVGFVRGPKLVEAYAAQVGDVLSGAHVLPQRCHRNSLAALPRLTGRIVWHVMPAAPAPVHLHGLRESRGFRRRVRTFFEEGGDEESGSVHFGPKYTMTTPANFDKFVFPAIRNMPVGDLMQLGSVQPVGAPGGSPAFELTTAKPDRPLHRLWQTCLMTDPGFLRTPNGGESYIPVKALRYLWGGTREQLAAELAIEMDYRSDCGIRAAMTKVTERFAVVLEAPAEAQIYLFSTDPGTWASLCGREGYAALIGFVLHSAIITRMN